MPKSDKKPSEKPISQSITWNSVRKELNATRNDSGAIDYDKVRSNKLAALAKHSGRPTVLYATDFLNEGKTKYAQNGVTINLQDVRSLAEVLRGIDSKSIDLVLHSPGGSPEAAESIVKVLRSQFDHIRVLVPVIAKSAATMIALAADVVLMPVSAELGPIDPQFLLSDGRGGQRMTPAQAIIDDVERALGAARQNQPDAAIWAVQMQGHPPGLYQQALNAVQLSKQLVQKWLESYMFKGQAHAKSMAQTIVEYLGNHNQFLSHSRRVDVETLEPMGANVKNITTVDRELWQLLEELWYTVEHNFQSSPVFKMWENSNGVGLFQVLQPQLVMSPMPLPQPQAGNLG
jgi:hypothetical protein